MNHSSGSTTVHLQQGLQRLARGDAAARGELLAYARRRLTLLAERMFARFPTLHSREDPEDLYQEAMFRLWQSLDQVGPTTVAGFMGLAALQMRRTLRELARRHLGRKPDPSAPNGRPRLILKAGSPGLDQRPDQTSERPDELLYWSEFHETVDQLTEPERTAFDLIYYHALPQAEVAALMQVSERQVRRYWQEARLTLHRKLGGQWPEI